MREMKNTQSHDEDGVIKPGAILSGNDYVLVTLRDSGDPSGRVLLVRKSFRCIHGRTICVECAESWELDHHVHYQQTGGGRRLREALDTQHLPASGEQPAETGSTEPDTDEPDSDRQ